ncbi:unnamed protein product [Protopolystoma xenopodis]|uniref:Uncharacterized protein n=1 Tax=Protopolystoma xenopodis TaxID=117903 RepID=A0A448WQY2_9PLAT|nr:unnamed protein product [Protopolystoma xenopodis]
MRRENLTLVQSLRKRKSGGLTGTQAATAALIFNPLRPCSSAVNLTAGIETAASSSKHQSLISSGELLVVRSANVGGDISPAPSTSSENCDAEVDGAGSHGESATPAASNGAISDAISEEEEDVSKIKEGSHIHRRAKPEKEVLKSIEGNLPGDHCAFSFSIGITPVSPVCSLVDAAQPAVTAYSASDQIVSSILPTPYDEKYDINSLTRKSALSGRSVSPAQSVGSSASSRSVVSLASSRSSKSHSQLHPIAAVSSTEGHLVCSSDSDDCAEAQGESEQEAEASGVLVLSTKSTGDSKRILMASQPQFSP